ncbi:MAG: VOC family protein [Betaproteobacteria bacterium]|nr:VOC family protein [Betaproteobacteria bacterium]
MTAIPLRQPVANLAPRAGFARIQGLHHWAFRCRDAEETRHFYTEILGLPLAAAVTHDRVPSTQEYCPYYHFFFELGDGSYLAFFDLLDGQGYAHDAKTPDWVNHLALEVDSIEALEIAKHKLEEHKVEVLGVIDHKWFKSIYFFDPNGIRLELACRTAPLEEMKKKYAAAGDVMATRVARKQALNKTGA